MKIVIFAGGTGKRFWPVSRKNAPKQFSPLISGKPLLRLRIDSLLKGFSAEDIYISTGAKFAEEVKEMAPELPEENLILEPEMRDTGPAVTLAVSYLRHNFPDEVVSIQWSDHLIKDETTYITALKESEKLISAGKKSVFITVPARFPSPHRGYIQFGEEVNKLSEKISALEFVEFKEKPTEEIASQYIASGKYGWNPGYWTVDPNFYLEVVQQSAPAMTDICQSIARSNFARPELKKFAELEKISADYIFAEKVQSREAFVLWTDIGWSDVGEWIALKEALENDKQEVVTKGDVVDLGSTDSIIYNLEAGKLVSTIGLQGMVVVNTPDAVAVFSQADNSRLKEYLKYLEEQGYAEYT